MRRTQVFSARSDLTDWLEPLLCGATWGFWGLRSCLSCTCPALLSLPLSLFVCQCQHGKLSRHNGDDVDGGVASPLLREQHMKWASAQRSEVLLSSLLNVCTLLHSTRTFTCRCCWLNTICLGPSIRHIQYTLTHTHTQCTPGVGTMLKANGINVSLAIFWFLIASLHFSLC